MLLFQHGGRMFDSHGGWWGFFGGVVPLLLFLLLIAVVVWAIVRMTARGPAVAATRAGPLPRSDLALEEVRVRYARGEVSREEFLERSRDLGAVEPNPNEPPPPPAG